MTALAVLWGWTSLIKTLTDWKPRPTAQSVRYRRVATMGDPGSEGWFGEQPQSQRLHDESMAVGNPPPHPRRTRRLQQRCRRQAANIAHTTSAALSSSVAVLVWHHDCLGWPEKEVLLCSISTHRSQCMNGGRGCLIPDDYLAKSFPLPAVGDGHARGLAGAE